MFNEYQMQSRSKFRKQEFTKLISNEEKHSDFLVKTAAPISRKILIESNFQISCVKFFKLREKKSIFLPRINTDSLILSRCLRLKNVFYNEFSQEICLPLFVSSICVRKEPGVVAFPQNTNVLGF